jgi:hypothetical protein
MIMAQLQPHQYNAAMTVYCNTYASSGAPASARHVHQSQWMFNGKYCDLQSFANEVWPEECEQKTFFLLKYTGE